MSLGNMNVKITINGADLTDEVISYHREQYICTGVGTFDIVMVFNGQSLDTWDKVVLFEEGKKKGTYNLKEVVVDHKDYLKIYCQDNSKRLQDWFVDQTTQFPYITYARFWIEKYLAEAGVNYVINTADQGSIIAPDHQVGLSSAYDIVMNMLQLSGWYMFFDANGVCVVGMLGTGTGSGSSYDSGDITRIQTNLNDRMLRNRAVVWGATDPATGESIFADVSVITQWNYGPDDLRAIVFSNSMIYNWGDAQNLANEILNYYCEATFEKQFWIIGEADIELGNYVNCFTNRFVGGGVATTVGSDLSEKGFQTFVILDQKCPRLWNFYDEILDYVYVGTDGSGVWRKWLNSGLWEDFSAGIDPSDYYITDIAINNAVKGTTSISGHAYQRTFIDPEWTQYIPFEETGASGYNTNTGITTVFSGEMLYNKCVAIERLSGNLIFGVNSQQYWSLSGENYGWVSICSPSGYQISGYQVFLGSGIAVSGELGSGFVGNSNLLIVDVDNNDYNNILTVMTGISALIFNHYALMNEPYFDSLSASNGYGVVGNINYMIDKDTRMVGPLVEDEPVIEDVINYSLPGYSQPQWGTWYEYVYSAGPVFGANRWIMEYIFYDDGLYDDFIYSVPWDAWNDVVKIDEHTFRLVQVSSTPSDTTFYVKDWDVVYETLTDQGEYTIQHYVDAGPLPDFTGKSWAFSDACYNIFSVYTDTGAKQVNIKVGFFNIRTLAKTSKSYTKNYLYSFWPIPEANARGYIYATSEAFCTCLIFRDGDGANEAPYIAWAFTTYKSNGDITQDEIILYSELVNDNSCYYFEAHGYGLGWSLDKQHFAYRVCATGATGIVPTIFDEDGEPLIVTDHDWATIVDIEFPLRTVKKVLSESIPRGYCEKAKFIAAIDSIGNQIIRPLVSPRYPEMYVSAPFSSTGTLYTTGGIGGLTEGSEIDLTDFEEGEEEVNQLPPFIEYDSGDETLYFPVTVIGGVEPNQIWGWKGGNCKKKILLTSLNKAAFYIIGLNQAMLATNGDKAHEFIRFQKPSGNTGLVNQGVCVILKDNGDETFTNLYTVTGIYQVEISKGIPTVAYNITGQNSMASGWDTVSGFVGSGVLPIYETFTNLPGEFVSIQPSFPTYDLRVVDLPASGFIIADHYDESLSGYIPSSGFLPEMRNLMIASSGEVKLVPISTSGESYVLETFSGLVNHDETTNYISNLYLFVSMSGLPPRFYQRFPPSYSGMYSVSGIATSGYAVSGTVTGTFVDFSAGLPADHEITCIRVDDTL